MMGAGCHPWQKAIKRKNTPLSECIAFLVHRLLVDPSNLQEALDSIPGRVPKEKYSSEQVICVFHYMHRLLVDPSDLREALDAIPGKNIRMGEMSDPSEVLETLYECLDAGVYLK
ncbi:hypothetical protein DUNSADRAFT_2235 [Dunaliella salina]|uniref:Uncharacterized protein n=1 Tax=Dunaliella salina TaxID=3046 RepID=A0ABQ7GVX0_DUNSA|nr:hypothetical protein DUNSADRAFT_2235 [Dunaliella salina]|eukprot:KAF5838772.1 hypothetical protein DUNSADRAFT_2235 [Dunaliella salina]